MGSKSITNNTLKNKHMRQFRITQVLDAHESVAMQIELRELRTRLKHIQQDINILASSLPQEVMNTYVHNWESVATLVSNIEVACDLSSTESLNWK
jgi:hypothetical protein